MFYAVRIFAHTFWGYRMFGMGWAKIALPMRSQVRLQGKAGLSSWQKPNVLALILVAIADLLAKQKQVLANRLPSAVVAEQLLWWLGRWGYG